MLILNDAVKGLCSLSRRISIPGLLNWNSSNQGLLQGYVVVWIAILVVVLVVSPDSRTPWGWILVLVATYRLQDLFFATLDDGLNLSGTYKDFDSIGRVLILLVNLLQIVIIFAILYRIIVGPEISTTLTDAHSRFDYFILSWKSLPPLGRAADLQTRWGQVLGLSEGAIGLVVGSIALSAFVRRTSQ